jgi:hypothetical protein
LGRELDGQQAHRLGLRELGRQLGGVDKGDIAGD